MSRDRALAPKSGFRNKPGTYHFLGASLCAEVCGSARIQVKANSERAEITRWTGLFGEAFYGQLPALRWAASGRGPGCSLASWTCCHSEELRLRRWEHSLESAVFSLQRR